MTKYMDEQMVRQIIRDELSQFMRMDRFIFNRPLLIPDGINIQAGKNTGMKIGTESTQKLGFYGKTPIVRVSAISSPSGGTTQDAEARAAIDSIRTALTNLGLTA